jgi:asparagine synthase (glutamine-hydrolysing)
VCGLTGFWHFKNKRDFASNQAIAQAMTARLDHRGPDAQGIWGDPHTAIMLGHVRLAIVDLSPAGAQPMHSNCGRWVIVYNGEIYNADTLRADLVSHGRQFRGHSDTEVLVEACATWGVEATCKKLIGMFAFALWDKQTQNLFLARDRLGIKPLYYGWHGEIFFFTSQLKSLGAHPSYQPEMNVDALGAYFRFNYIPAPLSIIRGIEKLAPGSVLCLTPARQVSLTRFWDLQAVISQAQQELFDADDLTLTDNLEMLLKDAVGRRMIADVPLGAFLSGGIDSSLVAALMQTQSSRPIKTFTIGFDDAAFNEAPYAKQIAAHLGTEHHELYLGTSEATDIISNIALWYDEPFADASQIPTFLVSKLASQHVKVVLSGDGGDELFAGYPRYWHGERLWRLQQRLPAWLRGVGSSVSGYLGSHGQLLTMFLGQKRGAWYQEKCLRMQQLLSLPANTKTDLVEFYKYFVSGYAGQEKIVLSAHTAQLSAWQQNMPNFAPDAPSYAWMQWLDLCTYLPDDILAKVDRASMAVSLEARVPLLDHRVLAFAWQLPFHSKYRHGQGKWLLRQVLQRYVPSALFERPKMGFGIPLNSWLRGPLRAWAETFLQEPLLTATGLNARFIQQCWQQHLSGSHNWQHVLWAVLMFQSWWQHWG